MTRVKYRQHTQHPITKQYSEVISQKVHTMQKVRRVTFSQLFCAFCSLFPPFFVLFHTYFSILSAFSLSKPSQTCQLFQVPKNIIMSLLRTIWNSASRQQEEIIITKQWTLTSHIVAIEKWLASTSNWTLLRSKRKCCWETFGSWNRNELENEESGVGRISTSSSGQGNTPPHRKIFPRLGKHLNHKHARVKNGAVCKKQRCYWIDHLITAYLGLLLFKKDFRETKMS